MNTHETTPDELLDTFRGRSMKSVILFTLAAHAVVLLGTSVPFLWETIAGPAEGLTEEQRVQAAVKEATASLRRIANQHGIQPQDLSSQLAGGRRAPAPPATTATPPDATAPPASASSNDDEPKSAIEEELETAKPGPEVPPIPEEEDLFK